MPEKLPAGAVDLDQTKRAQELERMQKEAEARQAQLAASVEAAAWMRAMKCAFKGVYPQAWRVQALMAQARRLEAEEGE